MSTFYNKYNCKIRPFRSAEFHLPVFQRGLCQQGCIAESLFYGGTLDSGTQIRLRL